MIVLPLELTYPTYGKSFSQLPLNGYMLVPWSVSFGCIWIIWGMMLWYHGTILNLLRGSHALMLKAINWIYLTRWTSHHVSSCGLLACHDYTRLFQPTKSLAVFHLHGHRCRITDAGREISKDLMVQLGPPPQEIIAAWPQILTWGKQPSSQMGWTVKRVGEFVTPICGDVCLGMWY